MLTHPQCRVAAESSLKAVNSAQSRFRLLKCLWPLLFGVALLILSACNAEVLTAINVAEDGSGTVAVALILDPEVAGQLPDLESAGIALADVRAAGWVVEPRELTDDGRTRIQASKAFANPAQFSEVMADISDGMVFSDFQLERINSFAQVEYAVTGEIAPAGLSSFTDSELDILLGESLESFAARLGADLTQTSIVLSITLPGEVPPEGSNGVRSDLAPESSTRFWEMSLAQSQPVPVRSEASTREIGALVALGVSVIAGILALLVAASVVLRVVQGRQQAKAKPVSKRPSARAPKKGTHELVLTESGSEVPVSANPTVVALDGMGVLYGTAADVADVLVPFCFERGSHLTADEIASRARQLSLGRIEPAAFWAAVGVEGDPDELDDEYLSLHALMPGVVRFLRSLRDREVRVACITNDSAAWVRKLRKRHSLDTLIDPWVISGAVGVRKPDRPIFEVLRRLTGEPPANILVVDDQLDILDAARALGYRTAWFAPHAAADEARGHSILRSFDVPEVPAEVTVN